MTGHNTSIAIHEVKTKGLPPGRIRLERRGKGTPRANKTGGGTVGGQIEEGDTNRTGKNEPEDEETEEKGRETGTQRKEGGKGKRGQNQKHREERERQTPRERQERERGATWMGREKKTRETRKEHEGKEEGENETRVTGRVLGIPRTNAGTGRRGNVEKTKQKINRSGFFTRVLGKQKTTRLRHK